MEGKLVMPIEVTIQTDEGLRVIRAIDVRYGTKKVTSRRWSLVCFIRGTEDDSGKLREYEVAARDVIEMSIAVEMNTKTGSGE